MNASLLEHSFDPVRLSPLAASSFRFAIRDSECARRNENGRLKVDDDERLIEFAGRATSGKTRAKRKEKERASDKRLRRRISRFVNILLTQRSASYKRSALLYHTKLVTVIRKVAQKVAHQPRDNHHSSEHQSSHKSGI